MAQKAEWEKEYDERRLMTMGAEPQADVLRFLRYLRKEKGFDLKGAHVLDLGCGTGRNANYLAGLGAKVYGVELAANALRVARQRAEEVGLHVEYRQGSIGEAWPENDASIDVLLDVTSSNSLNESERKIYLHEARRVLRPGGYFFVRALCKDGDKNAKELIRTCPGAELDTYVLKGVGVTERVFSEADFRNTYSPFFSIERLEKRSGYQRFAGQSYKRNYWLAYLRSA